MADQNPTPQKQLSPTQQIEQGLNEVRETLAGMRDALEDVSESTLAEMPDFLKTLENVVLNIDKADQSAAMAQEALEEASFSADEIEHVLRALRHLGLTDVDHFNMTDVKMAMEVTAGL
jgi:soluble cytochrome b562